MARVFLVGVLAAALPALVSAAQCKAIHYLDTNTAGGGPGGGAVTSANGINVYGPDGAQIGSYQPGDMDNPICQHDISINNATPFGVYTGHTGCDTLTISDCNGSYVNEQNIPGAVNNGDDYYGIGVSTTSECQVLFDC